MRRPEWVEFGDWSTARTVCPKYACRSHTFISKNVQRRMNFSVTGAFRSLSVFLSFSIYTRWHSFVVCMCACVWFFLSFSLCAVAAVFQIHILTVEPSACFFRVLISRSRFGQSSWNKCPSHLLSFCLARLYRSQYAFVFGWWINSKKSRIVRCIDHKISHLLFIIIVTIMQQHLQVVSLVSASVAFLCFVNTFIATIICSGFPLATRNI